MDSERVGDPVALTRERLERAEHDDDAGRLEELKGIQDELEAELDVDDAPSSGR